MPGVTKDQIARAKEINIEDYILSREPNNVKRVGSAYYLKDHDSLEIGNGLWNWHSQGIGGKNVVDYLIKVRGYSFVDAVRHLAGEDYSHQSIEPRARPPNAAKRTEREPFSPPPRNRDNNRVIAYLTERGIDRTLIDDCIRRGLLYESGDGWHNCVFLGRGERGKARFAALRGTMGDFKRDADGSDKSYGFTLPPDFARDNRSRNSRSAAVFESPVDALSHRQLEPRFDGWRLSLGGTALPALTRFLEAHPEVEKLFVCTDNDEAGNRAADDIEARFSNYRVTRQLPPAGHKDWNEAIGKEVKKLEDKRKDIIFRGGDYREMFRIKDGESIKFTSGYDGKVSVEKCRWIDECHTKIGSEYYHVDEWAGICSRNGHRCEPAAKPENKIDILAAKYGEALQDVSVPTTEAALRQLVGGKYTSETLYNHDKTYIYGALVRGADGIAVCGLNSGVLTSLHPYNAQTYKRELSPAERPPQETPAKKSSLLGNLEKARVTAAEQNAANTASADKPKKRGEELG
jgi:hypothetical protein